MIYTLATRGSEGISVIHDRNPMYVRRQDGTLRNGYTIRIVNKQLKYRDFIVSVDGLPSSLVEFVGLPPRADGSQQLVSVGPDQTKEVRVMVTDYSTTPPAPSTSILFRLIDIDSGEVAEMRDHFFGPEGRAAMQKRQETARIDGPRRAAVAGRLLRRGLRGQRLCWCRPRPRLSAGWRRTAPIRPA